MLTFLDLFAGVGGFREGMEMAGHKCIGYCEFDKFASASYRMMHTVTNEQLDYLQSNFLKVPNIGVKGLQWFENHELNKKYKPKLQKELEKEEYLNGEWFANDIRNVTARNIPKADVWCFGAPCFVKGTLITTERGMIPIEDIRKGDMVLTHKNRFRRVLKPMINFKKGIYTLKVQGSPKTEVTGNHRFYVRDKYKVWNSSQRRYKTKFSEPYWKEVQQFNGNEMIQFPLNSNSINQMNLTDEECFLLGRYVADGYLRTGKRKDRLQNYHNVIFCIGKGKKKEFEKHIETFKFGISEERTAFKFRTYSKRLYRICSKCGKGATNKVIPQFVMDLPIDKLEIFIDGYMSGDGCFTNNAYSTCSISKKLIYQLGQCVGKCYKNSYSIYYSKKPEHCIIENREVNQHDLWCIGFKKEINNRCKGKFIDDSLWMPIKSIEYDENREEFVYNMEVEEDNAYTANNMGCHNCQDFSIAGARKGMAGDRSCLVQEVFRILGELEERDKPKYIIYENVMGMLSSEKGFDFAGILLEMESHGYDIEYQNLNSKYHGVPQNRDRVYTIGHLRGRSTTKVFPISGSDRGDSVERVELDQIGRYPTCEQRQPAIVQSVRTERTSTLSKHMWGGWIRTSCNYKGHR